MKRFVVLAVAAIGLILPAVANAGAFQGVVIAKNPKRQAIVTTSATGAVRTVRAPKSFRKIGLGALVTVQARQLPDGTFAASVVKQVRRVKHAHVHATVVKRVGKKLFLSAANSVFAFGLRGGAGAKLHPGDRVTASASFGKAQLFCDDVKPVGHADQFELEGIYLSTAEGVLSLAVHGRGLVKVTVPDTVDLPTLKAGDEVSLVASVELDGTFTLVSIDNEDASDSGSGDSVDMGDSGFAVRGVLSSISPTSVGVRVEGHPEPVRCSVPPETNLSGFAVGQSVEMSCKVTGGDFVLVKLHTQTAGLPGVHNGSLDLNGDITALNSTAVTVAVSAESTPSVSQEGHSVLCALQPGADLRGFAIGDAVEVQCEFSKALGKYVLTDLSSDNATLSYGDTGLTEWFDLTGVLQSIRSDGVGIQVDGHQAPVNCAMPAGTDLSGFALGDTVELQCNFHDGKFNLASLSSDSAELTLE